MHGRHVFTFLIKMIVYLGVLGAVGCERTETLNTEYGRIRGFRGGGSINGTKLLADRFAGNGSRIKRVSVISPRLNQFSTIVWAPDQWSPPSEREIEGLERWLKQEPNRTLVYVGRDYDAELDYYQQVNAIPEMMLDEEFQRVRAEAIVHQRLADANQNSGFPFLSTTPEANSCKWFQVEQKPRQKAKKVSGNLADGIDTQALQLEYAKILVPIKAIENYGAPRTLLKVDNQFFVHARDVDIKNSYYGLRSTSKLIVVNNGSFLLNFGLVNRENQRLADALIGECLNIKQVAFLESGPGQAPVRDKNEPHQPWAWVTQPPLRYIVPHVLILAVLFCFVLYPIFGRPKRYRQPYRPNATADGSPFSPDSLNPIQHAQSMQSFRSHLVALANLLQRAQPIAEAKEKIKEFQEGQVDAGRQRVRRDE